MKIVLVFGILIAALAVASGRELRINGGNDAVRNQIPYIVSVQTKTLLIIWTHKCGGTIVNSRYVITAAQCTDGVSVGDLRIVAGILELTDSGIANQQTIGASQIIQHPDYPGGDIVTKSKGDISLIKLASILTLGENVKAIATIPTTLTLGTGVISGWGPTNSLGIINSITLQYASVTVINGTTCKSTLEKLNEDDGFDSTANICSLPPSTGKQSPCGSDVGGPLVINNALVGIISWGITPCGGTSHPYVHTNVANYAAWIKANSK